MTRASIRNVVFRGVKSRARNGFMAAWDDHKYHRAVHPEVVPENLPVCEATFEACSSDSPTRPSFISGNSNLSATLHDMTAIGRLVAVTSAVHPVAVELTLDACRFEPDERAATLHDVELMGRVSGRLVLEKNHRNPSDSGCGTEDRGGRKSCSCALTPSGMGTYHIT